MKDGEYDFGNNKIVKKNNQAFIKDDVLAGSVVNMHETFKNLIKINFSLNEAVAMTSYNAAEYMQEKNIGKIEEGYFSNLVVIDKNLNIKSVYLKGNIV